MDDPAHRLQAVLEETRSDLLAYALRRVDQPEDAADVVAETFLIAWRRVGDLPEGHDARLWLYGVARRVLANQRRGALRRSRLADRLRQELPAPAVEDHGPVHDALARLPEADREVLLLTFWEGLTPAEIASVMDVPGVTVRSRLHRARKRLHRELRPTRTP